MENQPVTERGRVVWLDALRAFSAFSVVWLHISSYFTENLLPPGGFSWWCTDWYLAFCRYAVPVFVMISGVFFLNPQKEMSVSKIYGKYIFRMLCVLLGWAAVRTAAVSAGLAGVPAGTWAKTFFVSVQMYWFLPMIIGLYMITPVLRAVTERNKKAVLEYFMALSVLLAMCVPVLEAAELYFFPQALPLSSAVSLIKLPCLVFGAHFVFGYYACTYGVSRTARRLFYAGGALAVLAMAAGGYAFFGDKSSRLYFFSMHGASLSPLTFVTGAAVFLAAREWLGALRFGPRAARVIERLARYSLGIYMLHLIVVETAVRFGWFKAVNVWAPATVPALAAGLFLLCGLLIGALYQIPWFRKYFL